MLVDTNCMLVFTVVERVEVYVCEHWLTIFYLPPFLGYTTTCAIRAYHQVGGFLKVLRFPPPEKLTATIELKYC